MINLRAYIRQIIKEAMIAPGALGDDFAVWSNWFDGLETPAGTELNFILYNQAGANESIRRMKEVDGYDVVSAIEEYAVAAIRARVPDAGYGECNQAWEIIRSAADQGYGPTLYDLVMSISPYGLTPDRSEVSREARAVWSYYANNRSAVDKQLLDPDGNYTYTEDDDCTMQGTGSTWERSPLPALHRQMAIDFLEEYYPVEYEEWMIEQDPANLEDMEFLDGNDYFSEVRDWIDREAESMGYEDWDPDVALDEWYTWKLENEMDLAGEVEGPIEDPQQLNMSYNTSYADGIMNDLIGTHFDWMMDIEDKSGPLSIQDDSLQFSVRNFFNEKYK